MDRTRAPPGRQRHKVEIIHKIAVNFTTKSMPTSPLDQKQRLAGKIIRTNLVQVAALLVLGAADVPVAVGAELERNRPPVPT